MESACVAILPRSRHPYLTRAALVFALIVAGCREEARAAATGLIETAEATHNPRALSYALLADGFAYQDTDPDRARDALHQGLTTAHDSGNRANESHLLGVLGRLEADHGEPLAALNHLTEAIRNYHDTGNTANMRAILALLAALLDQIGRHEPAATITGYAISALTARAFPELSTAIAHLRDVLGDRTYESRARKGDTMTTTAIASYAYDQIDQARTELEHRASRS